MRDASVRAFVLALLVVACGSFDAAAVDAGDAGDAGALDDATTREAGARSEGGTTEASCNRKIDCERVVFVTQAQYHPDELGGIDGARAKCAEAAAGSTHPRVKGRSFVPWLSDGSRSPKVSFAKSTKPYVLPSGARVANDWNDLVNGSIATSILESENGVPATGGTLTVWTGTNADGSADAADCTEWSSRSGTALVGSANSADYRWTKSAWQTCNTDHSIYCFEE